MERIIILTFYFLFCNLSSFGQSSEVKALIDTTIATMKKNSANALNVDWASIEKTAFEQTKGISDPYKLGPVIRYLFQSLDDFHGVFFYRDSSFKWQKYNNVVSDSIMNEWKKGARIKTKLLNGGVGYLSIPYISGSSIEEFSAKAQDLNDSLCYLLDKTRKGLVLDLRLNGGGAMHPMILGVQHLLGAGKIGEFHTRKKEEWFLKNNSFIVDTAVLAKIVPKCTTNANEIPIVILTSPQTGSSGEFLIMAFKGRPNTILIGTSTAGYVTVNNGFRLGGNASMNLAVGYGADRKGTIYREAIKPDVFVESPESFNDLENDLKVKAALRWISNH